MAPSYKADSCTAFPSCRVLGPSYDQSPFRSAEYPSSLPEEDQDGRRGPDITGKLPLPR